MQINKNILIFSVLAIIACSFSPLNAQKKMNIAEYEKRKRAFIEKEAGLTKKEADQYFPLLEELARKKFEINKEYQDKANQLIENKDASDKDYQKLLEDDVDITMKEAALDKEYNKKFKKILSPEKLYLAQQAEKKFIQQEVSNFKRNRKGNR